MDLGREAAERFTKVNSSAGHSRKPGGPLRLKLLFRTIVAVTALVPGLLTLQAVAGQAASAAAAPSVTSVSPTSGVDTGGTTVTISGSGFTGATAVMFGSDSEIFTVNSDTEITATTTSAEDGNGTVDVTVTTPDGTSPVTPADEFTFVSAPTVTAVSPDVGPVAGGTTVTITGTGFTGATKVLFGQTAATSFTVDSDTQVTATAPAAPAGGAQILVITPIGSNSNSIPVTYVYEPAPVVQSFDPATGSTAGGTRVSINGTGFTGATAVSFGSTPATSFTVLEDSLIFATAPAHSPGAVPITVTTPGGSTTTRLEYNYATPLAVTGVSPASGPTTGGNTVTITGTDLTNVSLVNFGSVSATDFTVDSDTQITAVAPPGTAGTVDVLVFNGTGTSPASAADQYTYVAPTCTTTITGTNAKQLAVTSGLTCLVNATQNGPVTVEPGAALSVANSTVNGTVTATNPAAITYCGSTEHGTLSVTGPTQGPVILGGTLADGTACAADTIPSVVTISGATSPVTVTGLQQNGTLTLENNSDGITLDGSQVNGLVNVENNTSPLEAGIMVSGNTVNGSLDCTGNNPIPIDYGAINTVSGTASGQCTDIAER